LDISDLSKRHNYWVALRQSEIERGLAGWAVELSVRIWRGCEVEAIAQDDTGVDVRPKDACALTLHEKR
jgi:2-polyprenyl-6-methoxyphenol hydroxylase-like FAD-dependent oxidoreductase